MHYSLHRACLDSNDELHSYSEEVKGEQVFTVSVGYFLARGAFKSSRAEPRSAAATDFRML